MINSDFLERAQWRGEAAKESQQQMEQMLQTSSFAQTPQQVSTLVCNVTYEACIIYGGYPGYPCYWVCLLKHRLRLLTRPCFYFCEACVADPRTVSISLSSAQAAVYQCGNLVFFFW